MSGLVADRVAAVLDDHGKILVDAGIASLLLFSGTGFLIEPLDSDGVSAVRIARWSLLLGDILQHPVDAWVCDELGPQALATLAEEGVCVWKAGQRKAPKA